MITLLLDTLTVAFTLLGAMFFLAGTIGLLRLPDFYTRAHAVAKCDTMGAGAILLALAIHVAPHPEALKIIVLFLLVLLSSPTSCHALARAAYGTGLEMCKGTVQEGP